VSKINKVACNHALSLFGQAESHSMTDAYDSEAEARHSALCLAEFAATKYPDAQKLADLIGRETRESQLESREDRKWQHIRAASALGRLRDELWPELAEPKPEPKPPAGPRWCIEFEIRGCWRWLTTAADEREARSKVDEFRANDDRLGVSRQWRIRPVELVHVGNGTCVNKFAGQEVVL
jgi:hypothetical protein